jgi:hypothetical protein
VISAEIINISLHASMGNKSQLAQIVSNIHDAKSPLGIRHARGYLYRETVDEDGEDGDEGGERLYNCDKRYIKFDFCEMSAIHMVNQLSTILQASLFGIGQARNTQIPLKFLWHDEASRFSPIRDLVHRSRFRCTPDSHDHVTV